MIIDKSYFHELASASPDKICNRPSCTYNKAANIYTVSLWGDDYLINPDKMTICCESVPAKPSHEYFAIFIIYYLLKTNLCSADKEWISENDIPGGTTFFRGPHLIPTNVIRGKFKNDSEAFKEKCRSLGGKPLDMADASFSFEIAPHLPIAVLYWTGDEDFPAEAKILYDKAVSNLLPLDIIFALAYEVCARVGEMAA